MLTLSRGVYEEMLAHAVAGLPNEACGLFASSLGDEEASVFFPMKNAAASEKIYEFDPREFMDVEARADRSGLQVIGVMHSHTQTTAYPSPTDVREAGRFDVFGAWHHVIVSLKFPEPVLRSYCISGGVISEEHVSVSDGESAHAGESAQTGSR